ncbi:hypothetical protein TNCV_6011 [Trichonephila clavipes]|nr:hypothetical protein TNCV_6011 [Trichonephila clavipes]
MIDNRAEKTERIKNKIDFIKIFAETVVWSEYSRGKAPDLSLVHSGILWKRLNHELCPLFSTSGEKELSNQYRFIHWALGVDAQNPGYKLDLPDFLVINFYSLVPREPVNFLRPGLEMSLNRHRL